MRSKGYNSCTSWVAAVACSVLGFLLPIPMRIAGLLFIIIIDHYETDRLHATIPIIVFGMIRALLGPFTGYLGQVFELREVTIIGSILATIGVGACFFAENINTVIIYLGLIYGMGYGLSSTLIPAILRQHFNEDLNLVNGVYLTGSCLGAIIMPQVVEFLIKEYGYSGMFLLLSGILLNSLPFAILLKDPKNEEYLLKTEKINELNNQVIGDPGNIYPSQNVTVTSNNENIKTCAEEKEIYANENFNSKFNDTLRTDKMKGVFNPSFIAEGITSKQQVLCLNFQSIDHDNTVTARNLNDLNKSTDAFVEMNMFNNNSKVTNNLTYGTNDRTKSDKYEMNISKCDAENCRLSVSSAAADSEETSCKSSRRQLFLLFLDPTFHIQMTIQSLHAFVTTLNWTILIDFARDKGISPSKSLYFLTYLPLSEMFGNLSLNWISDRGYMTRTNYGMICLFLLAGDSVFMVYAFNYNLIMSGVLIFGFVSGSLGATFPGMIHEFIEEDQQSMALASRFLLYAFLCLLKSPIIGYFRGTLGSYNWVFYIMAICCIFCGILLTLTPVTTALRRSKKLKNNKT